MCWIKLRIKYCTLHRLPRKHVERDTPVQLGFICTPLIIFLVFAPVVRRYLYCSQVSHGVFPSLEPSHALFITSAIT